MAGVEEGREFRFRGDLYSQESTLPLVIHGFIYKKCTMAMMVTWVIE